MTPDDPLVQALARRGLPCLVGALAPWPSVTPSTGHVLIHGTRIIAFVDWWCVRAMTPPSLGRHEWRWSKPGERPVEDIAEALVALYARWKDDEAGELEVANELVLALPPAHGGWRMLEAGFAVQVGVERGEDRRPAFLRVLAREADLGVEVPVGGAEPRRWSVRTRADVEAVKHEVSAAVRALQAWCDDFVARRSALEQFAQQLLVVVASEHLPRFGCWAFAPARGVSVSDVPAAWLRWSGGAAKLTLDGNGDVALDGRSFPADTPMTTLAGHVAARAAQDFELEPGRRYRVREAVEGLCAGDELRFRSFEQVRPRDVDTWFFENGHAFTADSPLIRELPRFLEPLLSADEQRLNRVAACAACVQLLEAAGAHEAAARWRSEAERSSSPGDS